jgi:hypothetical protein
MRNLIINLLISFLTIVSATAQKENKKSIAGINTGISVPYSDFTNNQMELDAGFAGIGPNLEVDLMRYTGRFFGLSSNIGYTNLFFNEKAYKSEYNQILGQNGDITVEAGNYQVLKGLLGIIVKTPEFKNTEILFIVQLGYSLSIHPEILVDHSEWGIINSIKKDKDWGMISNAGIKMNYYLSEKYGISINYNLNATTANFRDITSFEKVFNLPIRYQNINLGFVINL